MWSVLKCIEVSSDYQPHQASVCSVSSDGALNWHSPWYLQTRDGNKITWTVLWRRPSRSSYNFNRGEGFNLSHTWCPIIKLLQQSGGVPVGKKGQTDVGTWLHSLTHSDVYIRDTGGSIDILDPWWWWWWWLRWSLKCLFHIDTWHGLQTKKTSSNLVAMKSQDHIYWNGSGAGPTVSSVIANVETSHLLLGS